MRSKDKNKFRGAKLSVFIPREIQDASLRVVKDGQENDNPQFIQNVVASSATAVSCLRAWKKFTAGARVVPDTLFNNASIKGGWNDFHKKCVADVCTLGRVAIGVKFLNLEFSEKEIFHVPAGYLRKEVVQDKLTGRMLYSPYFGTNQVSTYAYAKEWFTPYDAKNYLSDAEKCREDNEYFGGQLVYLELPSIADSTYSYPDFMAASDAMKAEYEAGRFNYKNVLQGYVIGGVLKIVGNPDELVPDPDFPGTERMITKKDLYDRVLADNLSGSDNAGSLAIVWVKNLEEIGIEAFPSNSDNANMHNATLGSSEVLIARAWSVPPILAGIQTAGKLGDTKERSEAEQSMNATTKDARELLEEAYKRALGHEVNIIPIEPARELPPLSDAVTLIEKLRSGGIGFAAFKILASKVLNLSDVEIEEIINDNKGRA